MGDGEGAKGGAPPPAATPEPPKLPEGTPDPIKKFVACQAGGIRFKGGPIPFVKGRPTVTFEAGEQPGQVKVTVGWGVASIPITAEVKDGQLTIDASKVPDLSDFVDGAPKQQDFKDFADQLNAWLKANGRKLAPLELKDGQLTIRKQAVAAPAKAAAPVTPAPAPKPKETGLKAGPGLGARTGAGLGALALGFGLGYLAAPDATDGAVQPTEAVPVSRAQAQPMPVPEERTVFRLPPGEVPGQISISGQGGTFNTPVVFRQTDGQLVMELPASGLPVFRGPIDDQASFDVENDVASFTGAFDGNQVEGDHVFQGEAFTFDGVIQQPVVEDTVAEGPPVQPAPLVGVIGEDVVIEPAADGGKSGADVPGAVAGGALVLVGAGLLLGAGRSMSRDCSTQRAALRASVTDHGRAVERLQSIDEQLKAIDERLEESRGRLEAMSPGRAEVRETGFTAELVPAPEAVLGDLVASRPGADEATRDAVFGHGLGLKQQQQLRMERAQAERAVVDAAGAVRSAEAALAECEGRPPRTLEETLRDRPQPSVVETREVM